MVEQLPLKQLVVGSNPTGGTPTLKLRSTKHFKKLGAGVFYLLQN